MFKNPDRVVNPVGVFNAEKIPGQLPCDNQKELAPRTGIDR